MIPIKDLVIKAKTGNRDAYSELILLIHNDLYKVAKFKLDNEYDIEDAIQNAILNAYINIRKLRNTEYFKTWITKILINECNRIYKRKKKESLLEKKYTRFLDSEVYIDEVTDFDNITKILDETKKTIFELRYKEDLSIKQIAKKLNMPETTIKTHLNRGKQKIKKNYPHTPIIIFILVLFISTSIIAATTISYIGSLFEIENINSKNDNILTAIENLE